MLLGIDFAKNVIETRAALFSRNNNKPYIPTWLNKFYAH